MKQSWRVFWFGIAFVVFAVVTYFAFFHARLRSVPGPSFFSVAWWLERIEIKPEGRISHVEPGVDFTCISALPDGREIWVGGSKGVIIHSNDAGRTWEQLPTVTAEGESSQPPNEKAKPPEEQQQQQKKQSPPPEKSKSKAFYRRPSASSRFIAESSEKNEWIQVAEKRTPPPNAANQAAPGLELPNAIKNLPIDKAPANSANQAAPALTPSRTERGVSETPAVQNEASPAPQLKTSLLSKEITDLCYVTDLVGYALSSYGELIQTRDGGQTWRWLGPISVDGDTAGIRFLDENRGVAFGSFGVLRTLDGGVSWSRQAENYFLVSNIALTNGFNGQAVGPAPVVVEVIDGTGFGREFEIAGAKNPRPIGITNTRSGSLFACGMNGFVARGTAGGDWRGLNTSTTAELDAIFFASDRVGWAIGKQATVITTRDGGENWTRQITPGDKDLNDVYFSSERHGFAVGKGGSVIGTDDGGDHWYSVVAAGLTSVGGYAWLPAPWYFVTLIVLLGLVRRIPDEIPSPTRQGIAELLASDKPIGPGDPDYLGFQQTALGLSNYLRNNATKPPLTVAITGEWGMGKSSLMNLVQGDLRSYKFRPVWFNAWHHQTEESLLAALLENVRTQAIPSMFTPEGVVFRAKLLWLRARRNLFAFLLVVAAVSFCISYFAASPQPVGQRAEALTNFLADFSGAVAAKLAGRNEQVGKEHKSREEAEKKEKGPEDGWNILLALASATAALITFLKGFRAFGVDPSSLLASKSNTAKAKDLRAQTSFRYRFENQFHEVTNSLNPLTMVVFVDDLDRCRPEEVYNMLEAINFLVSCGDCFVIMGLARRRVERCVGLVFDKIAAEGPTEIDGRRLSRSEQRQRFAQMYLEKLVNIEVPVPKGGVDQIRTLLISKKEEPVPRSRIEIIGEKLSELVPHLIPASLAVVAAVIAVWCGVVFFQPLDNSGTGSGPSQPSTSQVQSPNQRQSTLIPAGPSLTPTASPTGIRSAKFFPGQRDRAPLWAILLVTAGILTPGIIRLSRRTGSVIEDSPEFTEALDKWFPFLVTGRDMTPRAIKRFVNRVRYFAMMEGSFRPVRRWWERLAQFLEKKERPAKEEAIVTPTGATREDLLVALATVHERHPEWFTGDLESFLQAVRSVPSEIITRDVTAIDVDTYDHFKKLVAGVEVR